MFDWRWIRKEAADLGRLALFTTTVVVVVLLATGKMP